MSVLPHAQGQPDDEARKIITLIRRYARRVTADTIQENIERIRGLHHILDAARDNFDIGLLYANRAGRGAVSCRKIEEQLGINKDTVAKRTAKAKELLGWVE